jgi:ABC-2 type transport system ATP-binding protein
MINIDHLKRSYDDFIAVDDVSFSIEKGEIVGLLGHNGAGKTTIMKMISGYLEPDNGCIEIDFKDMKKDRQEIQRYIGYLPEVLPIYPEMTVADYLDYAAELKGISSDDLDTEIRRVVQATDIQQKLLSPISTLSRGYKQRVGVAQAILGKPKLLILDEPTNGLDPTQTQLMRELIRDIAQNSTVIISTHIMQEVDALCDRVLIMRSGELALDAKLEEIRKSNRLLLRSDIDNVAMQKLMKSIEEVSEVKSSGLKEYIITFKSDNNLDAITHKIAAALISENYQLYELKREEKDLETVFKQVNEQVNQEVLNAA